MRCEELTINTYMALEEGNWDSEGRGGVMTGYMPTEGTAAFPKKKKGLLKTSIYTT